MPDCRVIAVRMDRLAFQVSLIGQIQVVAGIDVGYKYMILGDLTGQSIGREGDSSTIDIHNFMANLRYYFAE